jgi:Peptidase family S41/N-terminal domain of Peptidase_S41 in eukaryotic IRBP
MSEKIYAWLLRLYPSRFRETYGKEALQLLRDRCRDERGFVPRLRLWFDLLADFALSMPREYFRVQPELVCYSSHLRPDGVPSFFVLASDRLGSGPLLFGSVLSAAALVTFSVLLNHGVKYVSLSALLRPTPGAADSRPSAFSPPAQQAATYNGEEGTISSAARRQPEMATNPAPQTNAMARNFQKDASPQPESAEPVQPQAREAASPLHAGVKLDAAERHHVVEAAATILEKNYIERDNAQKMADTLRAHEKSGDDDAAMDGAAFAALLTHQMREVSPDRHLTLDYSETPLPQHPLEPTPEGLARYREALKQQNCTFEKVEMLPHNIGYLKLNSFPDPSVCRATATAAMASLTHANALIFDLRENRGGEPAMVAFMAAYFFAHPEYLYNPRENTTEQSWTRSPAPGSRPADKPVYVLTSARTFSGAEQFCYDLKMLKRITLVGETTGGAAHSGVWHRIDDHFGMGVPQTKAINPFSKSDWAEVGVEPDVKVRAGDALETAVKLAESKIPRK